MTRGHAVSDRLKMLIRDWALLLLTVGICREEGQRDRRTLRIPADARQRVPSATRDPAQVPAPPEGLRAPGRRLWREIWQLPQSRSEDRISIDRLCRLQDQFDLLDMNISEHGIDYRRPIVSPRGHVEGWTG